MTLRGYSSIPAYFNHKNYWRQLDTQTTKLLLCHYCIISSNSKEALEWLDQLDEAILSPRDLLLYCFFRFVLEPDKREEDAQRIDELLQKGVRREGYYFGYLVNGEHIRNDPDYGRIRAYAENITTPFQSRNDTTAE